MSSVDSRGRALREERARFRVRSRGDRPAGVVQQKREVEDKRILQFFEQRPIRAQLRVLSVHHLVKLVDANQGMFVGGVTMEKLVLHQAGELAEFRNVKRRMEVRGVVNNVTVYDDFAHHPTAIATTLVGFLTLAAYGGSLLQSGLVDGWAAWATIVFSIALLVLLLIMGDTLPAFHYFPPLLIGILLLVRG